MPVGSLGLGFLQSPIWNIWGGNKKTQGTQGCVVPQVLRSLGCLPSSHLSVFLCLFVVVGPVFFSCRREDLGGKEGRTVLFYFGQSQKSGP